MALNDSLLREPVENTWGIGNHLKSPTRLCENDGWKRAENPSKSERIYKDRIRGIRQKRTGWTR